MKQYSKVEMVSLFVATKMQIQVTNAYNLPAYGIAITVEESADFADGPTVQGWLETPQGKFCLVVWKLESGVPLAVTPVDIVLIADEVHKALHN